MRPSAVLRRALQTLPGSSVLSTDESMEGALHILAPLPVITKNSSSQPPDLYGEAELGDSDDGRGGLGKRVTRIQTD